MNKKGKKSSRTDKKREKSKYPLEKCLINDNWNKEGMANIFISRKTPFNTWIVGGYLVDLYCLGLKDTYVRHNIEEKEILQFYSGAFFSFTIIECPIELARQIVYGGIDYARDLGFSPHRDFRRSKKILGDRVLEEETFFVEFGHNGKPFYISGPNDDPHVAEQILTQLASWEKNKSNK